jgi:hypothetical protein
VFKTHVHEGPALIVGQCELLRVVREDADTVYALINVAIQDPALTIKIDFTLFGKRCGRDGEHSAELRE